MPLPGPTTPLPTQSMEQFFVSVGAKKMLEALIGLGVVRMDHPNQALRPGEPVGLERLDKALAEQGIHLL